MKIRNILATLFLTTLLFGCGGGGGGASVPLVAPAPAVATATGTAVNLAPFKGFYTGTATGSQLAFSLIGSDNQGREWTGSFAFAADGAMTFEGQNVTRSRVLITLKLTTTGVSASDVQSSYFLASNGLFYKTVGSDGRTTLPVTQTALPDIAHVGDSANLETDTNSDGTTDTVTWKLEPEFNGNSKLTFSAVEKDSTNAVTSTENNTFFLDANGNPYRYEVKVTKAGVTLSLGGNKS